MYCNTPLVSSFALFSFFHAGNGISFQEIFTFLLLEMEMLAIDDENYIPTHSYHADI